MESVTKTQEHQQQQQYSKQQQEQLAKLSISTINKTISPTQTKTTPITITNSNKNDDANNNNGGDVNTNHDLSMDEHIVELEFDQALKSIINEVTSLDAVDANTTSAPTYILPALKWVKDAFEYNLPRGKRNRGLAVVMTNMLLAKHMNVEVDLTKARLIGWCMEILQAHFLILDDIMDESTTRRGQLCWYLKKNVGNIAINDSFYMQMSIFYLIDKHFSSSPLHKELTRLFHETMFKTVFGQSLDLLSSAKPGEEPDLDAFTIEKYNLIVDYKTAIYSFSTPVRLGMVLTGLLDPILHQKVDSILRRMGHFFQVQDDYLDCYGDPAKMGKIGTDIEEGKCCWPIVMALKNANEKQRAILKENYGHKEKYSSENVKNVYKELNIEAIYKQYEKDSVRELQGLIQVFCEESLLPEEIFTLLLKKICGRGR